MKDNLNSATVMVVDDTPANLRLLEEILRNAGYRVLAFPRGDLALKAALKSPPDLILLDIMMPGMDGFDTCNRMKSEDALRDVPVLFISARADTEDKLKAFSMGGVDYVTKPFKFEEVKARVATHLELKRKREVIRKTYERLRELETQRDKLIQMIIHDMRSPLTAIVSNLELAQIYSIPEEAKQAIERSLVSTKVLMEMISSILDVSRMEERKLPLQISEVDMGRLLSSAIEEAQVLKGSRRLQLMLPKKKIVVKCDASVIKRVVQNLVGNALKFTDPKKGVVIVTASEMGKVIRVTVEDNGRGIPEEYQEKIFDKFFQVAVRESGQKYSTGLGLTFCKLAIDAHGGQIGVESKVDKGSRFWFEIPRQ